jgi:hypothetical protein
MFLFTSLILYLDFLSVYCSTWIPCGRVTAQMEWKMAMKPPRLSVANGPKGLGALLTMPDSSAAYSAAAQAALAAERLSSCATNGVTETGAASPWLLLPSQTLHVRRN